MTIFLNS